MITAPYSHRVSPGVLRRRRLTVAGSLVVLVTVVAASSGAAVTARLFDVGAALAAWAGAVALIHELRRPARDPAVESALVRAVPSRARVASVRRASPRAALADVA